MVAPASRGPFDRFDPSPDADFYVAPRFVQHIDEGAIEALRTWYAETLPVGGTVLDLMSSWVSHLPDAERSVIGLGMNAAELAANPQLDGWLVHDLNRQPAMPLRTDGVAATICSVSVQYLTRPFEVCAELARVTVAGGPVAFAFSNRCFPTKAIAAWMATGDEGHARLVGRYLHDTGFDDLRAVRLPTPADPLLVVWGRCPGS